MPLVRRRVAEVIARSGVPADSHTGKELLDVLETYPRDELLQVGADELLPVALAVLHLQERRQTRLFLRQDPTGRFWSALVYLPRDRYTTEVRLAMQQLLLERLGGTSVEYTARSTESVLARLHFIVRVPVGKRGTPKPMVVDVEALQAQLAAAARSWTDDLADALAARHGDEAERMLARVADAFPAAYQEDFSAEQAVDDLARLDGLTEGQLALRLWTPRGAAAGERRLTVYRVGERLLLSEVLPVLQHMGVDVVDERPYEIDRIGAPPAWIYDFGVTVPAVELPLLRSLPERFTEAVGAVWRGEAEDDGLGALVMLAGLNWRQVTVVRAYVQWLRQAGLPFGQRYVEKTLAAHPDVVARLVALFETRFSPGRNGSRTERQADLVESLRKAIGEVESLDADRVLSSLLAAVTATQRTTYYAGGPLALKLDPARRARPARAAPGARGVGQLAARHGHPPAVRRRRPRWAALVRPPRGPAHRGARPGQGADGEEHRHRADRRQGRLRRQAPAPGRRLPRRRPRRGAGLLQAVHRRAAVAHRQSGRTARSSRRRRSSGTTATTPTWSSPPTRGRRPSPTWPTRSRSSAASGSGTPSPRAARSATTTRPWASPPAAPGSRSPATSANSTSTSRSRTSRSSASATCPATSSATGCCCRSTSGWWPRSTTGTCSSTPPRTRRPPSPSASGSSVCSAPPGPTTTAPGSAPAAGCGRGRRSRSRSPEPMRAALGLPDGVESLPPVELIRAVLLAPVDLLFNGGIGTYVKASTESALDAGDKANDAVRVDGRDLRARVVGEGGNLGLTQRGPDRVRAEPAGG